MPVAMSSRPEPPTPPDDAALNAAVGDVLLNVVEVQVERWARAARRVTGTGIKIDLDIRHDRILLDVSIPLPANAFAVCCSTHLLLLLVQAALDRVRNHIPDTELENAKVLLLLLPREFVLSNCTAVDSFPVFQKRVDNPQYRTYIRSVLACVSSFFVIYLRHVAALD